MLECQAASLAAHRADVSDVKELALKLEALDRAVSAVDRVRADLAFHLRIAAAAHNPVIETMFMSIMRLSVELMVRSVGDPQVVRRSDPYHRATYEAIRDRLPDAAEAAMRSHLSVAAETYGRDYEERLDDITLRDMHSLGFESIDALLRDVVREQAP